MHEEVDAWRSSTAGSPSISSRARAPSASASARAAGPKSKLNIEIIGVVADALYEGPREGVHRQVFVPNWGKQQRGVLRAHHDRIGERLQRWCATRCKQLDAAMPVYEMKTVEGQLDETLLTDRLIAMLSAGFGLLATLLASIGLYGVMAFVVARRRKELGIRLALGAQPGLVIWLVMREVLLLLAIGLAVGIPAAMALGRYVSTQLYGIQPHDPCDRGLDGGAADARLSGRGPDSGAPRQPHRSDPGAAVRVVTARSCIPAGSGTGSRGRRQWHSRTSALRPARCNARRESRSSGRRPGTSSSAGTHG